MRRIAHMLPATSAMPVTSAAARRSPVGLSAVPVGFG
jgi:hypothetical protein